MKVYIRWERENKCLSTLAERFRWKSSKHFSSYRMVTPVNVLLCSIYYWWSLLDNMVKRCSCRALRLQMVELWCHLCASRKHVSSVLVMLYWLLFQPFIIRMKVMKVFWDENWNQVVRCEGMGLKTPENFIPFFIPTSIISSRLSSVAHHCSMPGISVHRMP